MFMYGNNKSKEKKRKKSIDKNIGVALKEKTNKTYNDISVKNTEGLHYPMYNNRRFAILAYTR
jgi:hypothetical protein